MRKRKIAKQMAELIERFTATELANGSFSDPELSRRAATRRVELMMIRLKEVDRVLRANWTELLKVMAADHAERDLALKDNGKAAA